jgi:nicotinate-nucleotide adenylyltransferase
MIGIFGGTFDPIHLGHLRSVIELKQQLALDELRLIPCHIPPHRERPGCSSEQRLQMVQLALKGEAGLVVDDCELRRNRPSYTIDTLAELRAGLGEKLPICLIMGSDAFGLLDTWQQWQDIIELAHIVVMQRPGEALPTQGPVAELLQQRQTEQVGALQSQAAGHILLCALTPQAISATMIRQQIQAGESVSYLLPEPVWHYIQKHQLYR